MTSIHFLSHRFELTRVWTCGFESDNLPNLINNYPPPHHPIENIKLIPINAAELATLTLTLTHTIDVHHDIIIQTMGQLRQLDKHIHGSLITWLLICIIQRQQLLQLQRPGSFAPLVPPLLSLIPVCISHHAGNQRRIIPAFIACCFTALWALIGWTLNTEVGRSA